jgi:ACT domain-containing protein
VILYFLKIFEKKLPVDKYTTFIITVEDRKGVKEEIEKIIEKAGFKILSTEIEKNKAKAKIKLTYTIRYNSTQNINEIFEKISLEEGLMKIELK